MKYTHPREIYAGDTEDVRRRWRLVRTDTLTEVLDCKLILSASEISGDCEYTDSMGETKKLTLGVGGLYIMPKR